MFYASLYKYTILEDPGINIQSNLNLHLRLDIKRTGVLLSMLSTFFTNSLAIERVGMLALGHLHSTRNCNWSSTFWHAASVTGVDKERLTIPIECVAFPFVLNRGRSSECNCQVKWFGHVVNSVEIKPYRFEMRNEKPASQHLSSL
ncbi:unnamed protein product [Peronospora belbahrii]|uniref:Uncharacterized protein n=1 Tax=Peronospora belbahrii TaxID=622444 RepID=A0ABN8CTA4_9STRA|nr:unnamed protein product [Peronospora belbahrii]